MLRFFLFVLTIMSLVFSPLSHSKMNLPYRHASCQQGTSFVGNILNTPHRPLTAETPASIGCVYGFTPYVNGCKIAKTHMNPTGGWGVIAVTEGGDDAYALQELNQFSDEFHLPHMNQCASVSVPSAEPCFAVVYATLNGLAPPPATGKDLREHAIDIEMAHAMAPNASIVMVEAPSFSQFGSPSIFDAVTCAAQVVTAMGGGVISNSWSIPEYAGENNNDKYFKSPGVVYFGSSGDELAPAHYPSSSPNIVSVGATEFIRDSQGNFVREIAWHDYRKQTGTTGGPSQYEPRPPSQDAVMKVVGEKRGTPDVAAIGHNVVFYYQDDCTFTPPYQCKGHWLASSGTSFASPIMAGIVNRAHSGATSSQQEATMIYTLARKNYHLYWHDIIEGNNGFPALQGYDFVTGLGTPLGYLGK